MEAVKHGYEENRRILTDGLPKAGLDKFLPVDGAFYLYADIRRFSDDSLDFAKRMLNEAGVAATPGIDFDPIDGRHFLRFCYAGSAAEMHEAVERIGTWLSKGARRNDQSRNQPQETARRCWRPARRWCVPGAHDPVSAMLVERAGFPAVYIGSYATAAAGFGLPDVGLVTMEEMAAHAKRVADASRYSGAGRRGEWLEQRGEHLAHGARLRAGRRLRHPHRGPRVRQARRRAAGAAVARAGWCRRSAPRSTRARMPDFLIIARTDAAWAFNDVEEAVATDERLQRSRRRSGHGGGSSDPNVLAELRSHIKGKIMITDTPGRSVADEEAAGADVVLYYGLSLYAGYHGVKTRAR